MSAETIPAEVATDLDCIRWYVECLDAVAFKRRAVAGLAEAEGSYNAAMKRLADRSTRPAETAGCMCRDVAFGSHKVAVPMKLPAHMQAEEQARIEAGLSPYITVDACLVEEVSDLWAKGIRTTGCCCGHNKAVGYIGVNKGDIPAMKGLGYVVRENTSRPGAQDGFVPQSIKYGDRPAEPAAPVAEAVDGEMSHYIAKCREMSKGENGHTYTWWSRLAELLSTLEAERARADAAEQRAADALARAEKAKGALDVDAAMALIEGALKWANWCAGEGICAVEGEGVIDPDALLLAYSKSTDDEDWETLHERLPALLRASREAQPATDGSDNG